MPETPLPDHPDFGFFAAPDVSTDRDEGDEAAPVKYPTRDHDFDLREIDRLQAQLETAREALKAARELYKTLDYYFATKKTWDNTSGVLKKLNQLREVARATLGEALGELEP